MPGEGEVDGMPLDLRAPRVLHVVGVGGVGMSAIALLLARMGHRVSGSDVRESVVLERLRGAGVTVHVPNDPANVPHGADAVVYSTAVPRTNVELAEADRRGITVLHRSGILRALSARWRTVAVAGAHGKTSTSSMLALVLRTAGWEPSFVIGADPNEAGANAGYGTGEWFVVEADESDGTFLELLPEAALVTNVEPDHLGHYGGFEGLVAAFERFVAGVPGVVVCCADDPIAARLAAARPGAVTYGAAAEADYLVSDYHGGRDGARFTLTHAGAEVGGFDVPLGVCSALNAAGAAAVALELGVDADAVRRGLAAFGGVARRFQFRGERDGVAFVDDYAHLPSEVAAAIATAREAGFARVVAVFQPHRYTRTVSLGPDFADAFTGADAVVLTDVYPAGEAPIAGVSGRIVLRAVLDHHPDLEVAYYPRRADLLRVPARFARPGDVVLTLGAGDLTSLPDAWLDPA